MGTCQRCLQSKDTRLLETGEYCCFECQKDHEKRMIQLNLGFSKKTEKGMMEFFSRTSLPRILAERKKENDRNNRN